MSRFLLTVCLGLYALVGGATGVEGQADEPVTEYDTRALRIEARSGNWLLVRGREGTVLGKIGAFRGLDLADAVAPSANAVREAKEFKRDYNRGSAILGIGIAAWGIGMGLSRVDDLSPAVTTSAYAAVAAGTIMIVYGGGRLNKGLSALARSIWWYNRDLGR